MRFLSHPILKTLRKGTINALIIETPLEGIFIVSLYDDDFYTQIDFDIIDGKTRSLITAILKKVGYDSYGSRHFISPEKESFFFPKPSHTLGCNPADKVKEGMNRPGFYFTTPTQALLLLLSLSFELQPKQLTHFLHHQPVNIKKLFQWAGEENQKGLLPFKETQIQEICNEGNHLRKNRKLPSLELEEISSHLHKLTEKP